MICPLIFLCILFPIPASEIEKPLKHQFEARHSPQFYLLSCLFLSTMLSCRELSRGYLYQYWRVLATFHGITFAREDRLLWSLIFYQWRLWSKLRNARIWNSWIIWLTTLNLLLSIITNLQNNAKWYYN